MLTPTRSALFLLTLVLGCGSSTPTAIAPAATSAPASAWTAPQPRAPEPGTVSRTLGASPPLPQIAVSPECSPADWSAQSLEPLLLQGKGRPKPLANHSGANQVIFDAECTDTASSPPERTHEPVVVDGVQIAVSTRIDAGTSGRHWAGNRCEFELRLAEGGGMPVVLAAAQVPPFNTIRAVVRSGAAAWLSVGFNGYTREFPNGGNRIVALDLCQGRVIWQSKDGMSNGGLLLLDHYLVSAYGFTSEARYVYVLDAHSGNVIQKLPVIENVCPSKRWLPNWTPGERCDTPGQRVGAADQPRIEDGVFFVDTNTGSSKFYFR